jgi:hypothetical protein
MFYQDDMANVFDFLIILLFLSSCLCAPISRWVQMSRQRRANMLAQQMRANQGETENTASGPYHTGESREATFSQDKNLQAWEEILLTTNDHGQKLEAISKLGKLGTKDTLDLLSEYAENDRDPEVLAAIENALELIERRQIEQKIKGEIQGTREN